MFALPGKMFARANEMSQIISELYGSYRAYFVILVTLGLLGGILESIGVSILIPLFSHVSDGELLGADAITKIFDSIFKFFGIEMSLHVLLPLMVILFTVRAVVLYVFDWVRASLTSNYEQTVRSDMYASILSAPWRYLSRQRIGFAENTMMVDVAGSSRLFGDFTNAMQHISSLIVYAIAAYLIDPVILLVTLGLGMVLFFAFSSQFSKTKLFSNKIVRTNKAVAHDVNESIIGLKTIKALGVENDIIKRTLRSFGDLQKTMVKQVRAKSLTTVAIQPASILFIAALFAFSFLKGDFNFAVFGVSIFLILRIFVYFDRAQNIFHRIAEGIPYARHVAAIRKELKSERETDGGGALFSFKTELAFDDVSFTYGDRGAALSGITMKIARGGIYAVVGPSGAGKTTLVDLILRLIRPETGPILLDGVPINDIDVALWRDRVGYVAQEPFILNASVEDNIRFFSSTVTDADVEYALVAANLTDLIARLPQGKKSMTGERGIELSGGERQRIALARILARRPELLVLDEATSALDLESQQIVQDALLKLKGSITMVIIAHRPETIRIADTVIVLREGRLVEVGTPKELLESSNASLISTNDDILA